MRSSRWRAACACGTSAGDLRCARCLVCAGAGTDRLVAPLGIAIARDRRAALRLTFRTTAPAAGPMPVWSDRSRRFHGERAYGTPEGLDRYAVGLIATTEPIDAPAAEALPAGAVDVRAARRRLIAYVRAAFPGLHPEPVDAVLRLIAPLRGPDEDRLGLWERDGVLAFAGHNLFKHAPRLGELLADAALVRRAARPAAQAAGVAASPGASRTAIVMRTSAQRRPWSSVISTSHTHVVRPRWRRRASAWIVPSVIGRRKLVWFDSPWAMRPSGITASAVASDVIDSAIDANTPPCTSPIACLISSRTGTRARTRSSLASTTSRP